MRCRQILAVIPALMLCAAPAWSQAAVDVSVSVNLAPPPIPVYEQPPLPAPGYLWTPGYWAWDGMDYYWVPGTWILPPSSGLLWTPGFWGWRDGFYAWNAGYWGPEVGFYGGIDYGFGYTGAGYHGGYWHGGAFFYNRSVANFGHVHVANVYTAPAQHWGHSHVSFNGGQGGTHAQPSAADRAAMGQHRGGPTPLQREHEDHARTMPVMHAGQNGGHPQVFTTQRPGDFAHPGPGLHNHQTPVSNRGGQGAQLGNEGVATHAPQEHNAPTGERPGTHGATMHEHHQPQGGGGSAHFAPHEQAHQLHEQAPRQLNQQHGPVQEHGPAPEPRAAPQAMHEQGPRAPQGQHEAPHEQGRHEPGHH